jgi:NAD(P)-dependent dehydrogenase (short-subunit alcohol dehydrogenase family)
VLRYASPATTVVPNYQSNLSAAKATTEGAEAQGAKVVLMRADIADPARVAAVVDAASQTRQLDVLVHNPF